MTTEEQIGLYEAALVECFDAAIPQAIPWTGTLSEKAEYAAKMLPQHLRGLLWLHAARLCNADSAFPDDVFASVQKAISTGQEKRR